MNVGKCLKMYVVWRSLYICVIFFPYLFCLVRLGHFGKAKSNVLEMLNIATEQDDLVTRTASIFTF